MPDESVDKYKSSYPWNLFGTIVGLSGSGSSVNKVATPSISYADKQLSFGCATEGVQYVYDIKVADRKSGNGSQAGRTVSRNGTARVSTTLQPGSIAVVKVGSRTLKVVLK